MVVSLWSKKLVKHAKDASTCYICASTAMRMPLSAFYHGNKPCSVDGSYSLQEEGHVRYLGNFHVILIRKNNSMNMMTYKKNNIKIVTSYILM
jgi:hypothetical protein